MIVRTHCSMDDQHNMKIVTCIISTNEINAHADGTCVLMIAVLPGKLSGGLLKQNAHRESDAKEAIVRPGPICVFIDVNERK